MKQFLNAWPLTNWPDVLNVPGTVTNDHAKKMSALQQQIDALNLQESLVKQALAAKRPLGLGPKQLAWCRANLGNFAKYESQVLASKGERQAELAEKKERE